MRQCGELGALKLSSGAPAALLAHPSWPTSPQIDSSALLIRSLVTVGGYVYLCVCVCKCVWADWWSVLLWCLCFLVVCLKCLCIFPCLHLVPHLLKWLLKPLPIKKQFVISFNHVFQFFLSLIFLFSHPPVSMSILTAFQKKSELILVPVMQHWKEKEEQEWWWEVWERGLERQSVGLKVRHENYVWWQHNLLSIWTKILYCSVKRDLLLKVNQQICIKIIYLVFKKLKYQTNHVAFYDRWIDSFLYPNKREFKILFVNVFCCHLSKKTCRLYMSLESRQYVICNWDTASILSATKWVILGCIISVLYDVCAPHSGLLVQISKATFNTASEIFDS